MQILQRIALQAPAAGSASRVADGSRQTLLSDLYRQAAALAATLRQQGVTPGSEAKVLLLLPRSERLIVSHLAVFLAGGVIVPADPKTPAARLQDIVEEARPAVAIIGTDEHADAVPDGRALLWAEGTPLPAAVPATAQRLEWNRSAKEAAYIIFTSGTTGKPKGVVVELGALEHLLSWHIEAFGLTADDCVSLTAAPGFDASVWEIWASLAAGASMHVATDDDRLDPHRLQKLWKEHGVTHSFVSTPLAEQLLGLDWSDPAYRLRCVLTGGDRLTNRPAPGLPFRLVNNYGPSEGTVVATSGDVEALTADNAAVAPHIGYPLGHMQVRVLNEDLRPVASGEPGRLWIGGGALARGYLNRDDQTREKFRSLPGEGDVRFYDTGDIVSVLPDGAIRFHGRDDSQVKIDGVRIELTDIESVIALHEEVAQAVASVIQLPSSQAKRVVCTVVPREAASLSADDLRAHAEARLPRQMVPVQFLVRDALPLTANGKVDRRELEQEQVREMAARAERLRADRASAPMDSDLSAMLQIWSDVLELPASPDSDLFDLGGNSISAARIAARVAVRFGKETRASHVLTVRTPAELTSLLPTLADAAEDGEQTTAAAPGQWFPVTPMQRGLWYLWKTHPENAFYNIAGTFLLAGEVQAGLLRQAVLETISRHDAMRTMFRQNAESLEIEQSVAAFDEATLLERIDFQTAVADRTAALAAAEAALRQPFDLEQGRLFRALFIPAADGEHLFQLACHHIVGDGLSLNILLAEIAARYGSLQSGASMQEEQEAPFARYVNWQETSAQRADTVAYWKEKAKEIKLSEFPTDRERDGQETRAGRIYECESPAGLGERIDAFCKQHRVSRFVAMMTAWALTVSRYCHQEEVTVGVPFHGRTHSAFENAVGMFVNVLPVPLAFTPGQSFADIVRAAAAEMEQAVEHADFPIIEIAALARQRDGGFSELVNTTFSEKVALRFPLTGVGTTFVELDTAGARFELSAFLHVQGDRVTGHIEYASDLFDESTIADLAAVCFGLLDGALAKPDAPWEHGLPEGPRFLADQQVLDETHAAARPLHALVEETALRHPDAPALIEGDEVWTYRQLEEKAGRIAAALQRIGVGPRDKVPLLMDRSAQMIAAILGVLKLGAVYVPLDPENPVERNAQLIQRLEARHLVTFTKEAIPQGTWQAHDTDDLLAQEAGDWNRPQIDVTDPAYLLFTSGSTGEPKGVLCPHLGAAVRVQWQVKQQHLQPGERVLFKTPYTFDVSIWELFYPLAMGAALVISPPGLQRDPIGIARLLAAERVTLCHFVPAMLQMFLDALESEPELVLPDLRYVHTSGEALATRLAQRLHWRLPQVRILNLYGPTETGIEVTCYDFHRSPQRVNIGPLLPHVSALIADRNGRPVPQGFPGELLIGGPSLAIGYFNRPEETERVFISLVAEPGANEQRYYRTGDLVRHRPDGSLDYLGRMDAQVKVRGVRVEPGEIEAMIAESDDVQEAVVVIGKTASGLDALVCFYVPKRAGETIKVEGLKSQLARKLPAALIPALYVPVESLPLNKSGKRDRKALAQQAGSLLLEQGESKGRAPQTPLEQQVAAAWSQVLKQEEIGVDQNFFELGGDSVRVLQVVNLLGKSGLTLSPRDFFHHQTIAEQAHRLAEESTATDESSTATEHESDEATHILPLAPLQSVMLVETLKNPDGDAYWQLLAYQLPASVTAQQVQAAWSETVQAHPALRTKIVWNADQPQQHIEPSCTASVETIDWQSVAGGTTLEQWAAQQIETLRGSGMADLQRVACIENWQSAPGGKKSTLFVWAHHHILIDGWSMAQVLGDFFAVLNGENTQLAVRPSLKEYFTWRDAAGMESKSRAFWKQELAGVEAAETLHFEKTKQDGEQPAADFRSKDLMLSQAAATTLTAFCQRHRVTAPSVITFLWGLVLRPYQDRDELCIGMTFANRPHSLANASEISGMLINTLPVRVRFAAEQTFAAGCRDVLGGIIGISEHTGSSYASLLEVAGLPGMTELFKSTIIFQNYEGDLRAASQTGAEGAKLLLARGTSTDPLSLTVDAGEAHIAVRLGWDETLYAERKVDELLDSLSYWLEHLDSLETGTLSSLALVTPRESQTLDRLLRIELGDKEQQATTAWSFGQMLQAADPAALALDDGDKRLTYAELKHEALVLAARLRSEGVLPGDTVVFVGQRSTAAAVAISAAWLIGAAWCSLDPHFPAERQQNILHALQPKTVVTLDSVFQPSDEAVDPDLLATDMQPGDLAYFISTSGSTGAPKLVSLQASGLPNVVAAWKQYYGLHTPQRVLQVGSWTSDVFLGDFLKAASTGGTLVICPEDKRIDMEHLTKLLLDWEITFAESTPALIGSLLRHLKRTGTKPHSLRTVIVGADVFRLEEQRELVGLLWDGVQLYNGYGLSECTIESVVFPCAEGLDFTSRSGLAPLGAPLPGTRLRIVDRQGRDLPPGAVGELHIGGPQVSRGYLTADEGLLTDRFYQAEGTRYFNTGDFVRLNEAGILEFYGRRDNQIKVRGYRVELGEIENALLAQPGVLEAAVFPVGVGTGLELVAFISGEKQLDLLEINGQLQRHLPPYAVPHQVVELDKLPRNANGKIDRVTLKGQAAEALAVSQAAVQDAPAASSGDPVRDTLVELWSSLLGRAVRTDRSFFDQGGHSLLALRLFDQMKERLPEEEFSLADLFRLPSIDAIALELKERKNKKQAPKISVKQPSGIDAAARLEVLQRVQKGEISPDEAMKILAGSN